MSDELDDAELVTATRAGGAGAYKRLVARYQGHVYALAYSLVGNWADAQDVAQETFIRAYSNLDQLREPAKFAAWLRRVTFGVTMNWLKAYRPTQFKLLDGRVDLDRLEIPEFRPGPAEVAERRELADAVMRAVGRLPPKYRVPLTMFHLDGLSYQKVAQFLDIPLGTAKALIHRAKGKLKAALAAYVTEEVLPMVQEVFNEHKLPAEFAQRVIEQVPTLAWGRSGETTFCGALAAALKATDRPVGYDDLMGFTGLAFRTRWYQGPADKQRWCPSSPVGEFPEEIAAAGRAIGWTLRTEAHMNALEPANMARFAGQIVASIDAGRPVLAYESRMNMAVIHGYRDGGRTLLMRDYFKGEADDGVTAVEADKIGPMLVFLERPIDPPPARENVLAGLRTAISNFARPRDANRDTGGGIWYGPQAFARWAEDLLAMRDDAEPGSQAEKDRAMLFFVSWWVFDVMADAREAAIRFLSAHAAEFSGAAQGAITTAAELYRQEQQMFARAFADKNAFFGPWSGKSITDWTPQVRQREAEILGECCNIEQQAIALLREAVGGP